jgi:hypothetical protein
VIRDWFRLVVRNCRFGRVTQGRKLDSYRLPQSDDEQLIFLKAHLAELHATDLKQLKRDILTKRRRRAASNTHAEVVQLLLERIAVIKKIRSRTFVDFKKVRASSPVQTQQQHSWKRKSVKTAETTRRKDIDQKRSAYEFRLRAYSDPK